MIVGQDILFCSACGVSASGLSVETRYLCGGCQKELATLIACARCGNHRSDVKKYRLATFHSVDVAGFCDPCGAFLALSGEYVRADGA